MTPPDIFKLTPEQAARLKAANLLLAGTSYKPRLYPTTYGLRIFVDRMESNRYANIDKLAIVNPSTGFFQKSARNTNNAGFPWGSGQECMIAELVTWVLEGGMWRKGHWPEMVRRSLVFESALHAYLSHPCVTVAE